MLSGEARARPGACARRHGSSAAPAAAHRAGPTRRTARRCHQAPGVRLRARGKPQSGSWAV
eukprot:scaffold47018_cov67-Phaeocystis_antarctica.AAC.3